MTSSAISSALAPNSIANAISAIISPQCGPIICTPKTLSDLLSAKIFTKPSVSLLTFALELAKKWKFSDFIRFFFLL